MKRIADWAFWLLVWITLAAVWLAVLPLRIVLALIRGRWS